MSIITPIQEPSTIIGTNRAKSVASYHAGKELREDPRLAIIDEAHRKIRARFPHAVFDDPLPDGTIEWTAEAVDDLGHPTGTGYHGKFKVDGTGSATRFNYLKSARHRRAVDGLVAKDDVIVRGVTHRQRPIRRYEGHSETYLPPDVFAPCPVCNRMIPTDPLPDPIKWRPLGDGCYVGKSTRRNLEWQRDGETRKVEEATPTGVFLRCHNCNTADIRCTPCPYGPTPATDREGKAKPHIACTLPCWQPVQGTGDETALRAGDDAAVRAWQRNRPGTDRVAA